MTIVYYYIKLGESNALLPYWLQLEDNKNPYGEPCVAIYFHDISIDEFRKIDGKESFERLKKLHNIPKKKMGYGRAFKSQIKPFIEEGKNDFKIITIFNNIVYLLEPVSEAEDLPEEMLEEYHKDLEDMKNELQMVYKWKKERYDQFKASVPKVRRVNIVKKLDRDIPHVLLTLSTVRYYNSGTFRRINPKENIGVYRALEIMLGSEKPTVMKLGFDDVLELLSPHQFETLVFLVLINANLFSPAWRAGSLPGIDLVGINYSSESSIKLGVNHEVEFSPNKEVKFQLKRKRNEKHYEEADYTIMISSEDNNKEILTAEWLYSVIKNQEKTITWLENSLRWYVKGTKFNSVMELIEI